MTGTSTRIIALIVTGGLFIIVLELVRRKRLMERYALLWLGATAVLIVLAAWNGLLSTISSAVGVYYPPSLLFAVAFGFELVLLLHFSITNSRLTDQNKVLAQRLALVQRRLEEQEQRLAQLTARVDETGLAGEADDSSRRELTRAR